MFKLFFFGYNEKAEGAALKVKTLNSNNGYSLLELMVIISIITLLAGVSTPLFRSLRQRAKEAVAIQDMGNNLRPAVETFRVDVGEYPVDGYSLISNLYTAGSAQYSRWASGGPYMNPELAPPPATDADIWVEDPWGQPYMIFSWGFTRCIIVSSGHDKTLQTDITATFSETEPNRNSGRFTGNDDLGVVIAY